MIKRNMDERFTKFADHFSELMGRWQTFLICLVAIIIWFVWGPFAHWSDTWQLSINTPTTIAELFQEIIILAAANRVERRNRMMLEKIANLAEKIESEESQAGAELVTIEKRLEQKKP